MRYEEEDIPNDFPLRTGDIWEAKINIDSGKIDGWPNGRSGQFSMKVCDEGTYELLSCDGEKIASLVNEYVPCDAIPGSYGDYVEMNIDETGVVTNWHKKPDVSAFFRTGN